MDIEALTKQALDGNMLTEVGREFFTGARSEEETRSFLTALLERAEYENLATVMSSGCIDKHTASSYLPVGGGNRRVSDRYFAVFIELVEKSGVDMELVWPMFFAAFDAPKDGYLYSFAGGIDGYFKRYAYADYDSAVDVVRRWDRKYKCLSTLMEVDRARTLDIVLDVLIYGKNANKTALRKYLMEKRIDIVPALCNEYIRSSVKAKEGIVRLLLLYKGDPRADRFLGEIERSEKSLVIKKLIDRDRGKGLTKSGFGAEAGKDCGISSVVNVGGSEYTVALTKDFSVEVSTVPYPKVVRAEEENLRKRLKKVCRECEAAMSENARWESALFLKRLESDKMFAAVASSLLFTAYNDGGMSDIIIVEDGEIRDLDNNKRALSESEVAVSHPTEWERFGFLHGLDVVQPFAQVGREVFVPTDAEKSYNSCGRLKGRVMPAGDFKESLSKHGYKLLNKNRYDESDCAGKLRGDVMCVLEFDPTNFAEPDRLIAMGNVRFYRYADLIKLGGQIYTDGVKPFPVQLLSGILFSEFLRDVFEVIKPVS